MRGGLDQALEKPSPVQTPEGLPPPPFAVFLVPPMDRKYIFGTHTGDMPGLKTIQTLYKRQIYLIKKVQENAQAHNEPLIKEIRALEKTMNFIKWITDNASNDVVRQTIEQYYSDTGSQYTEETADEDILREKGLV